MFEVVSVVLRLLLTLGLQLCPPEAKQVLLKRIFPVLLQDIYFCIVRLQFFFHNYDVFSAQSESFQRLPGKSSI